MNCDTTPPTLNLPANMTVEATSASGTVVTFTATADDANPAHPAVTCAPASGSTFGFGKTTVNCSATDAVGNTANGSLSFQVSPAEGYGQEDARSMVEIPKSQLPPDLKPEVVMTLYTKGQDGQPIPARIAEVKQDTVIMNFNHPLAGKTLNFDIEVIEIK